MLFVEVVSGLWVGDVGAMSHLPLLRDQQIGLVMNCTDLYEFPNHECVKVRVPLPSSQSNESKVGILRSNYKEITKVIASHIVDRNIFIGCSDGTCIGPLVAALYMKEYGNLPVQSIYDIILTKDPRFSLWCDLASFT